jgi:hypothetical protein
MEKEEALKMVGDKYNPLIDQACGELQTSRLSIIALKTQLLGLQEELRQAILGIEDYYKAIELKNKYDEIIAKGIDHLIK